MTGRCAESGGATLELFSCTADGVWAVDSDQRVVFCNQAAQELLGYPASAVVGQLCYRLLAGRDPGGRPVCKPSCAILDRALRSEPAHDFDLLARRSDGCLSKINVSIVVLPAADNASGLRIVHMFRTVDQPPARLSPLRIHLLGQTAVYRPDSSLVEGPHWRRARVRALFAFLALERGMPVHRDVLMEALWPDLERRSALHNLTTTVYYLRLSLEPALRAPSASSFVEYGRDCYSLNGEPANWLDVQAFENGIAQARREPDPDWAMILFRETLALYRGDFLADLGDNLAWCWRERMRLRELYLNALEDLGQLCERCQEKDHAMELYLRALTADPCRESACQCLMRLALERGDQALAVALYRELARALQRELGISPSGETRLLYETTRSSA